MNLINKTEVTIDRWRQSCVSESWVGGPHYWCSRILEGRDDWRMHRGGECVVRQKSLRLLRCTCFHPTLLQTHVSQNPSNLNLWSLTEDDFVLRRHLAKSRDTYSLSQLQSWGYCKYLVDLGRDATNCVLKIVMNSKKVSQFNDVHFEKQDFK
jgi:hypothetical protein